jgi:hypothetical protein
LTRTNGALDSSVTELGGDIVYDKRCVTHSFIWIRFTHPRTVLVQLAS